MLLRNILLNAFVSSAIDFHTFRDWWGLYFRSMFYVYDCLAMFFYVLLIFHASFYSHDLTSIRVFNVDNSRAAEITYLLKGNGCIL